MLVLSRKQNESLQIDSTIQITVISIGKGRVRLGINAPDHVRVLRNELLDGDPETSPAQENAWPQQTGTFHRAISTLQPEKSV